MPGRYVKSRGGWSNNDNSIPDGGTLTVTTNIQAGDLVFLFISTNSLAGYSTHDPPSWLGETATDTRKVGGNFYRHTVAYGFATDDVTSIAITLGGPGGGTTTVAAAGVSAFSGVTSLLQVSSNGLQSISGVDYPVFNRGHDFVVWGAWRENNVNNSADFENLTGFTSDFSMFDGDIAGGHAGLLSADTDYDVFGSAAVSGSLSVAVAVAINDTSAALRVRSNVSEDAGSILDSASLNAVDASFSEAFLLDVSYAPTVLKPFVEALAPLEAVTAFYPIPRQSTEFLNDYSGETLLSRMTRVYPPPIFGKVDDLGLTTFTLADGDEQDIGEAAIAQNVIDYVLTQWASEYAWFTYETVPDLRLKVEDDGANGGDGVGVKAPSEYGASVPDPAQLTELASDGWAYAQVIQFSQDEDSRKTMRQILDELLSPFPGTVVRANASGSLEIVPVYGPDASNDPVVTLTDKDAYTVTRGQPSPTGVINKWTFRSQPYVLTEDGGLLNQSWFQVCSNNFPSGNLYATGTGEDISSDDPYPGGWNPKAWSPQSGRIPDSPNGIKLTDSGGVKQVTIDYKYSGGSGSVSASDITLTDIPLDGSTVLAIEADGPSIGALHIEISGRYDAATRSVYLWPSGRNDFENANGTHVFRINLLDATDVWQAETTTVTGTYSLEEAETNPLPGNPVTASVAAYGEREKTVDITGWGIQSGDQLARMARAAVFEAVQPTLIRTVEQSVWRAFPVKFSHMGSVVELPSGEQGRVVNRTYADDFGTNFGPGSMSSTVKVEVIDQDGDGVIDVDTEYLLLDDGSAFMLDDDTQAVAG